MGKPGSLLDKLTPTYAAGMTLIALFGFGWTGRSTLSKWVGMPEDVERHGDAIVDLTEDMADMRRAQRSDSIRLARIECVVLAMALKRDPVAECGL